MFDQLNNLLQYLSEEKIKALMEQISPFDFILAFLLPFIESFLPFLPLFMFAVVNVNAFGVVLGFILTYTGTVSGCFAVFALINQFQQHRWVKRFLKIDNIQRFIDWVDHKGSIIIFIMLCIPFTPSSFINVIAALSNITYKQYLFILIVSKFVMIFIMSFVGHDIASFFEKPIKSITTIILLVVLYFVAKFLEKKMHKQSSPQ